MSTSSHLMSGHLLLYFSPSLSLYHLTLRSWCSTPARLGHSVARVACLCCTVHCPVILQYFALKCTVLHYTILHCNALHCTALHQTALHFIVLHFTVLHCIPSLFARASRDPSCQNCMEWKGGGGAVMTIVL